MAKKKSVKGTGRKRTPSIRKAGAGARAMRKSGGGRRKTAGARTPQGKARKKTAATRAGTAKRATKKTAAKGRKGAKAAKRPAARKASTRRAAPAKRSAAARKASATTSARVAARRRGGTGRESELAQTPETGRSVRGRTNPMKTVRSTGTPAGAGSSRVPALNRDRRRLRELDETVQGPPSSLDLDRTPSAAASGRRHLRQTLDETNETGPVMTGGDVDADWSDAYAVGDEAPGGDNPTPDQDIVDDIGRALGVEYQDNEELKGADKIAERDRHRWELDPASSDDYKDRD